MLTHTVHLRCMRAGQPMVDAVVDANLLEVRHHPGILVRGVFPATVRPQLSDCMALDSAPLEKLLETKFGFTFVLHKIHASPPLHFAGESDHVPVPIEVRYHFALDVRPDTLERQLHISLLFPLSAHVSSCRLVCQADLTRAPCLARQLHVQRLVFHHLLD